ncbi:hypothetical protein [Dongia deserti]|uniref:hypothetical protein n=1 Tax=Dongia deserti TaxID=2268030 RepID=UPI000E6580CF|nr:hypothetical protein [Dongia deserti]
MSASEDLGNLLRVMEEHLGAETVELSGEGFANWYSILVAIKRQVVQLERQPVPADARICKQPPWEWGSNVVSIASRQRT